MKYRAIIFDMDGTIVDTEKLWQEATHKTITNRGYQLKQEEWEMLCNQFIGIGLPKSCQIIKDLIQTQDSIEIIMKEKTALACELYKTGIKFIPGFHEFHQKAAAFSLKMGVATNACLQTLENTNKSLNLTHYFGPHLYTINHVNNIGKPNPAIYLYAAQQLGIDPSMCIAIEDSAHGIMAAKAAGMFCIGINTSKKPEQIKEAHLIIEGYEHIDLESLLLQK